MLELLLWPFLAGLVLTGIHAYFGLHVLARGVVFVDLSLAQVAALGLTIAILAGHSVQSEAGYWYALGFATAGAVLFSAARPYEKALQQEALIGIVYAVSASLGVLALDRAPQGTEHIKQLLIGSILTVTPQEVGQLALLYIAIGAVHLVFYAGDWSTVCVVIRAPAEWMPTVGGMQDLPEDDLDLPPPAYVGFGRRARSLMNDEGRYTFDQLMQVTEDFGVVGERHVKVFAGLGTHNNFATPGPHPSPASESVFDSACDVNGTDEHSGAPVDEKYRKRRLALLAVLKILSRTGLEPAGR